MEGQQGFIFNSSGFLPNNDTKRPPKKRLIVCCDGTWQSANHGIQATPSNIAKMSRAIAKYTRDPVNDSVVHQVVWYDAGIGTGTDSVGGRVAGFLFAHQGMWGQGLDENVCEAYHFLSNNFNPGDELYFFGFSRGAYTARAAAGLVATVGICKDEYIDDFYKMYNAYKAKDKSAPISGTEWGKSVEGQLWLQQCSKDFTIKAVGVFDTVGALGWPDNVLFDVKEKNKPFAFHNTDVHPSIENAFQALALDEHRASFPPTLWELPPDATTRLIQCWFPGYHINSGGGSGDFKKAAEERQGDFEAMANITFSWMVDRLQEFTPLGFNRDGLKDIVARYSKNLEDLIEAQASHLGHQHNKIYRGWGVGPNVDSFNIKMALAGSKTRTPDEYNREHNTRTNEYIHPVVAYGRETAYDPLSLKGFTREKNANGKGYTWRKTYTPSPNQSYVGSWVSYLLGKTSPPQKELHLSIPEFVIPTDRTEHGEWKTTWGDFSMERHIIRADTRRFYNENDTSHTERGKVLKETMNFIRKMDKDNGFREMDDDLYTFSTFFNMATPAKSP